MKRQKPGCVENWVQHDNGEETPPLNDKED